jgi:hypothetical protein
MWRLTLITALVGLGPHAFAAGPAESLLPASTKGFLATSNVAELRKAFELTQPGELARLESFQPLVEDLQKQLDEQLRKRIGVKLDDVMNAAAGELAIALIQPDPTNRNSHAVAVVADVKGERAAAEALVASATKNLLAKKAKQVTKKAGDATLTMLQLPAAAPDKPGPTVVFCVHADTVVLADDEKVAAAIVARLGGGAKGALQSVPAFGKIGDKTWSAAGKAPVHLRWFIEPLDYAEASRAALAEKKRRGPDPIKILRGEGFEAVAGIGGCLQLHADDREIVHRTYAYAPPANDAKKGERFRGAANLLEFPNAANLTVQPWVPNAVSRYLTFQALPDKVFRSLGSLYDARADEPGLWQETLAGLKGGEDKGPKIDVSKELVAHLSGRVTLITHYHEPINTQSERWTLALELQPGKDAEIAVRDAIEKLIDRRDMRKMKINGEDAWELLEELTKEEKERKKAPKSKGVLTVQQAHLFFGSHADYLETALEPHKPADQLQNAADLKLVEDELAKLGSRQDSFRFFTRGDESWRVNYELLRKGEMPSAQSLLGKWLSRMLPAEKGTPRKQLIKPELLPPFADAVSYLGPAGSFTQSDDQGWLTRGVLLKKP